MSPKPVPVIASFLLMFVICVPDASAGGAAAVDLQPRTLQAWQAYQERVDQRYEAASASGGPFFALDAHGVQGWREQAIRGEVAMTQLHRATAGGPHIDVPGGNIHHWVGAVFIPNTSVAAVLDVLAKNAGKESGHYQDVIDSKLLSRDGDRYRVFLKLRRSKVITVTYNTEHDVVYRRLAGDRATARSVATRIAELENAGTPQEREKPVGSDGGYLWRLNAYWRYQAVERGVLVECESVSLSRDVPFLLRPFISGVVEGLARESLERTLLGMRAVLTRA